MGSTESVLLVHTYYQQPGGEDEVFRAEADLLEAHGHHVTRYTLDNRELLAMSPVERAQKTLWNQDAYSTVRRLVRQERADVVHFHNTFPHMSPSVYYAARGAGAGVVQTLHNYRLLCPNAEFFRAGRACEDCLGKPVAWPGVVHGCYRGSRPATAVTAAMLAVHRVMGTWRRAVNVYIAMDEGARARFVRGGLPADRLMVKPNFVPNDPGVGDHKGDFALYVGRLTQSKGIRTLLAAWEHTDTHMPLQIAGDGPLRDEVASSASRQSNIIWHRQLPRSEVSRLMRDASMLVFPSVWYEGMPMVIAEAFAAGLPVIASATGAMLHLVEHERTGLHVPPGDAAALGEAVRRLWREPDLRHRLGRAARRHYELKYTAEHNYFQLTKIYTQAAEA